MGRIGDDLFITGTGRYVADLCDTDTHYASFARSVVAHARLGLIDLTEAVSHPNVIAAFSSTDLSIADIPGNTGRGPDAHAMSRPPLARDRVRFVGEPLAVVIATDPYSAADGVGVIWPELEELEPVVDPHSAETGSPLFAGGNVVTTSSLVEGPEPGSAPSLSVTVDVPSPRLAPSPIEPLAILARPEGERLHIWCGHQAPHRLRGHLASGLSIEEDRLRVTVPAVGGAFGMKGMLFPEYLIVAAAALKLGKPVAWLATRREQFLVGTHGRGQHHRVTLEGTAAGRVQLARIEILADAGAYPHNGSQIPTFSRLVATGLYDIPRVEVETKVVVTNAAPTGSYRGAGRPEAALAIERAIDAFARAGGLDPVRVRLDNMIRPDQLPHRTPTGALYDSGDYPAALLKAMDAVGLDAVRRDHTERLESSGSLVGVGFGAFVERAGGAPESSEYGAVEIDGDGRRIVVRSGSVDSGQGHAVVWRELVSEVFEIDSVDVLMGDTDEVPQGTGTFASRSAQLGGSALLVGARRLLERARRAAAERLEAAAADMIYTGGVFSVVGSPGSEIDLWALADEVDLREEEVFSAGAQTFPYGVHVAVVGVQPETGEVEVVRIVAVDDAGTILDPMIVEGQLHGSLTQGLGQALLEVIDYDRRGQLLTSSFMDYPLPRAGDVPFFESHRMRHPAPSNPLGVKGVGESGSIGLPPAILNAVIDALWPLGVRDLALPLTPFRVWEAIQTARAEGTAERGTRK